MNVNPILHLLEMLSSRSVSNSGFSWTPAWTNHLYWTQDTWYITTAIISFLNLSGVDKLKFSTLIQQYLHSIVKPSTEFWDSCRNVFIFIHFSLVFHFELSTSFHFSVYYKFSNYGTGLASLLILHTAFLHLQYHWVDWL